MDVINFVLSCRTGRKIVGQIFAATTDVAMATFRCTAGRIRFPVKSTRFSSRPFSTSLPPERQLFQMLVSLARTNTTIK